MRRVLTFILMFFLFPTLSSQAQEDTAKKVPTQAQEDSDQKKPASIAAKQPQKSIKQQDPIVPFKPTEAVPADAIIAFPTDI